MTFHNEHCVIKTTYHRATKCANKPLEPLPFKLESLLIFKLLIEFLRIQLDFVIQM